MPEGGALINLGDLSKPATVLVEKVCGAVGVLFEPTRIKRQARAEAEADKIKALARIELRDIEQRALERFLHQEARKQENIESITAQAAASLPHDAKVEGLEEDWIANFFEKCQSISDQEMQSLWSRLLAGEATAPGTYSKRTVDFVSTIDKKDAALFTKFCQFVWMIGTPIPLIFDVEDDIYKSAGIHFSDLKHLDAIGLISFESVSGYIRKGFGKNAVIFYYGKPMLLEFANDANNQLQIGHALLTNTGAELVNICGSEPNEKVTEYVARKWADQNVALASIPLRSKQA
jgi:hypothetical protein